MMIDFGLVAIDYELWTLGKYLDVLEHQLPFMKEQERRQALARIRNRHLDWPETEMELQKLHELVDNIVLRLLRSPFLVSLWSVYEAAVIEIAGHLQRERGEGSSIEDIRRGSFLNKAKKYFNRVLRFRLCTGDPQEWEWLDMLAVLRNAVAHSGGRIAAVRPDIRKKIDCWQRRNIGISVSHGYLTLSHDFLQTAYGIVNDSLSDLLSRVRALKQAMKTPSTTATT